MLGLSSMMLVIGLITDKRNAAESNQMKWTLDAVMVGWCVGAPSVFKRYFHALAGYHHWQIIYHVCG